MILDQDERVIKFVPVRLTLETMKEFEMFTKIIQDYKPVKEDNEQEPEYLFSIDIYNKLNEIHSL